MPRVKSPLADVNEEWRPVVGYDGLYEVSSKGRVRRTQRQIEVIQRRIIPEQVLKPWVTDNGYPAVKLRRDGKDTGFLVHRLVLEAFKGMRPNGQCARHRDGRRAHNGIDNLMWGTYLENSADQHEHGTVASAKLNAKQVAEIKQALALGGPRGLQKELAARYGVQPAAISAIACGRSWKQVP